MKLISTILNKSNNIKKNIVYMFNKKYKNESIAFPINELLADRSRYQSNRKTPS